MPQGNARHPQQHHQLCAPQCCTGFAGGRGCTCGRASNCLGASPQIDHGHAQLAQGYKAELAAQKNISHASHGEQSTQNSGVQLSACSDASPTIDCLMDCTWLRIWCWPEFFFCCRTYQSQLFSGTLFPFFDLWGSPLKPWWLPAIRFLSFLAF